MKHGIYFSENSSSIQAATQVSQSLTVALGTAEKITDKPQLIYTLSEYTEKFGKGGTLDEVAQVLFGIYQISPAVFVNVLDKSKHFKEVEKEFAEVTTFKLTGNVDSDTVKITTGEYIPAVELENGGDFEVIRNEDTDADTGEVTVDVQFKLLDASKLNGGVKITYRTLSTALGGEPVETEVTLAEGATFALASDTVVESVTASSIEINTLKNVGFAMEGDTVTLFLGVILVDGKIKVTYHEIDATKVTGEDIIGALDQLESVYARFNLTPGIIIAPEFSLKNDVAAALANKAKNLDCMAINDIDAESYTDAIERKNAQGLAHSNLITCFPKVTLEGNEYFLSTHLAALMNVVDFDSDDIPYQSPSNKNLMIDGAVSNGKEIYLNQEQANLLNAAGIVTAFSYTNWKCWGNFTSMGEDNDYKDKFISVRRMCNFLKWYFRLTYFQSLDQPVNLRQVEAILQSANIYLGTLASRGILLGGRLEFNESENPTTELQNGALHFNLYILPPPPMQEINISLEIDLNYFDTLFAQ